MNLDYRKYIRLDKKLIRPKENIILRADNKKAKKILKWKPKTTFKEMIYKMIDSDIENLKKNIL